MKFIYSVIGDNSQENREWLEKVGCSRHGDYRKWEDNLITFLADDGKWYYKTAIWDIVEEFYLPFGSINCIGNPQLFKAVSAMREDSDYMQLFYIDVLCGIGGQMVGSEPKKRFWSICKDEKQKDTKKIKATLTELQERFKLK